jgi:hypothetical protein
LFLDCRIDSLDWVHGGIHQLDRDSAIENYGFLETGFDLSELVAREVPILNYYHVAIIHAARADDARQTSAILDKARERKRTVRPLVGPIAIRSSSR